MKRQKALSTLKLTALRRALSYPGQYQHNLAGEKLDDTACLFNFGYIN